MKFPVLVTLFRRANNLVMASFRSRNGEALKVAEKFQGGGHANAAGAILPKSVRNVPDAVEYLRQILQPKGRRAAEQHGKFVCQDRNGKEISQAIRQSGLRQKAAILNLWGMAALCRDAATPGLFFL